ncbi:MrcB family domain-containing protein [Geodermatophilus sp. SYSU D00804]
MQPELEEILLLQTDWTSGNSVAMQRRGVLIRTEAAGWLRDRLDAVTTAMPPDARDLAVTGRDSTGLKAEVPWIRIFSATHSPSPQEGWYLVYLFSALGDRVYLSLNQGTTVWVNGEFRPRPAEQLRARVEWARALLADRLKAFAGAVYDIKLDARSSNLGRGYERGNVVALEYPIDAIPADGQLNEDLQRLAELLGAVYASDVIAPGEIAPEVADAVNAAEEVAEPRRRRQGRGYRLNTAERLAIEQHAVRLACQYLKEQQFTTIKDVGSTESYDIDARKEGQRLYVEVKGTVSAGVEVILTKAEVELHKACYPNTALIVVHSITLQRGEKPVASGGVLKVISPWSPEDAALTPITYRYTVTA